MKILLLFILCLAVNISFADDCPVVANIVEDSIDANEDYVDLHVEFTNISNDTVVIWETRSFKVSGLVYYEGEKVNKDGKPVTFKTEVVEDALLLKGSNQAIFYRSFRDFIIIHPDDKYTLKISFEVDFSTKSRRFNLDSLDMNIDFVFPHSGSDIGIDAWTGSVRAGKLIKVQNVEQQRQP